MTTKLYFCSTCCTLWGDDPKDSIGVEDGRCLNCDAGDFPAVGEFDDDAATNLLNRTRYGTP